MLTPPMVLGPSRRVPLGARDVDETILNSAPLVALFGEAGAEHDNERYAFLGASRHRRRHGRGRHRDNGAVEFVRDLLDGRISLPALNFRCAGIDRINSTGKAELAVVRDGPAADFHGVVGGADDGDRLGIKESL